MKMVTTRHDSLTNGLRLRTKQIARHSPLAKGVEVFANWTLAQIAGECLRTAGLPTPENAQGTIRAAISAGDLNDVLTATFGAQLIKSYHEGGDSTLGWCRESEVPNFRDQQRIRLIEVGGLARLARGETPADASIAADLETYKVARYARKFVASDEDLADDLVEAINAVFGDLGRAAARLRPDLVYSLLLSNPTLSDDVAMFDSSRGNLGEAESELSTSTLQIGIAAIQNAVATDREGNAVTLNCRPRYLVVPPNLTTIAAGILHNLVCEGGIGLELRVDARIGTAGVTDPATGEKHVGTATNWYLLPDAAQGAAIEIGYFDNLQPELSTFALGSGQWGVGWRVKLDIAAKALGWRGCYKATGAA